MDQDQARHFVRPDLGPICLQRLSAVLSGLIWVQSACKDYQQTCRHIFIPFQKLDYDVVNSDTGEEYINDVDDYENIFVVTNFKEKEFEALDRADVRIIGPPVVIKCARDNQVSFVGFIMKY